MTLEVSLNIDPASELGQLLTGWLAGLSELDPDRHDCEAFLYMMLAKSAWRRADQLREAAADRARRQSRRKGGG